MLEVTTIILGIEAAVLASIILLWAVSHFRDELIRLGWLSRQGWLARTAEGAERARIWHVLESIGFREDHFQAVARGQDTLRIKDRYSGKAAPLSHRLLPELKKSTVELEPGYSYKSSGQYYIDSMGAMSFTGAETSLAIFLEEWVQLLQQAKIIPSFDFILARKDGNVAMARQFLTRYSPSGDRIGIACKADRDRSRVSRLEARPHDTDFEGLRALFSHDRHLRFPMNGIAVDDNCTGGSSLCNAMRSFNELLQAKGYQINPVKHAVVLFTVKSEKTQNNFQDAGFDLHALLSFGRDEMAALLHQQEADLIAGLDRFKRGFGCDSSRSLNA